MDIRSSAGTRRAARSIMVGAIMLAGALLGSCGSAEPPTTEAWSSTWEAAQATVPDRNELGDPPSEASCQRVLGQLREVRGDLTPAPDEFIQHAAEAWISYAEHVFFSCFEAVEGEDPVDAAYETLDRLRAEVATALRTKRDG